MRVIYLAVLLLVSAGPVLAQNCPKNSWEVAKETRGDEIRVRCACNPGYVPQASGICTSMVSREGLGLAAQFFAGKSFGEVRVWISDHGTDIEVSYTRGVAASGIETGPAASATFFIAEEKRITLGEKTRVVLGPADEENMLNITEFSGTLRMDDVFSEEARARLRTAKGYARKWSRGMTRQGRFKIHTPFYGCCAIQGTDFTLISEGQNMRVSVISGKVGIERTSGDELVLDPGDFALLGPDEVLESGRASPRSIERSWRKASGVKRLSEELH